MNLLCWPIWFNLNMSSRNCSINFAHRFSSSNALRGNFIHLQTISCHSLDTRCLILSSTVEIKPIDPSRIGTQLYAALVLSHWGIFLHGRSLPNVYYSERARWILVDECRSQGCSTRRFEWEENSWERSSQTPFFFNFVLFSLNQARHFATSRRTNESSISRPAR